MRREPGHAGPRAPDEDAALGAVVSPSPARLPGVSLPRSGPPTGEPPGDPVQGMCPGGQSSQEGRGQLLFQESWERPDAAHCSVTPPFCSSPHFPGVPGVERRPPGPGRAGLADPGGNPGRSLAQLAQGPAGVSGMDTAGRPPRSLAPRAPGRTAKGSGPGARDRVPQVHLPSPDGEQQRRLPASPERACASASPQPLAHSFLGLTSSPSHGGHPLPRPGHCLGPHACLCGISTWGVPVPAVQAMPALESRPSLAPPGTGHLQLLGMGAL